QMAKNPDSVLEFLEQLIAPTTANAHKEESDLEQMLIASGEGENLQPYDWSYYAEKIRLERYDLDENLIKPYFQLYNVLENGVSFSATELFGVTFERREERPVYHEDVRVYEIFEEDGTPLGLFCGEFFKRENKRGGAWMGSM